MRPDFNTVKNDTAVRTYIAHADAALNALGYTEHSFAHVTKCAETAADILTRLGYDGRHAELARIAGFLHDIGNMVNRTDHAHSGALMAFQILNEMGMEAEDLAIVVAAIGNHDERTAFPVNAVAAALIIADKIDVRRSRVRSRETIRLDIHDRVNYAVEHSELDVDAGARTITLHLGIDIEICPVMEYFEIFLSRMLLCRKAAGLLNAEFKLVINGSAML